MKQCYQCGKSLMGNQRKFCCVKCKNAFRPPHSDPLKRRHPQAARVDNCVVCGKMLTGRRTRFCSIDCKNEYHQAYANQKERGLRRKLEFIQKLGGQCAKCGYKKNLAALSFHHVGDKNHPLDMRSLANRAIEVVIEEFEQCELLCANCHMELHYPHFDMGLLV